MVAVKVETDGDLHIALDSLALMPVDSRERTIFVADAHRGDGKRFLVRADEKLKAFVETRSGDPRLQRIVLTNWCNFSQTRRR
ncbi:MAG: hypothetical protein DME62_11035 [Verrucomicrobia bacterium]|nr:MAG: hypothetical protein DME62_11035 [Verrucomicrobiota bacterium]